MPSQKIPSTISHDKLLDCILAKLKSGEIGDDKIYFADLLLSLERKAISAHLKEKQNWSGQNKRAPAQESDTGLD